MQKGGKVSSTYVTLRCWKCRWKKLWAETRGGHNEHFLPLSSDSECKTKNWYVTLQVDLNHLKNSSFLEEFHSFWQILAENLWQDF